MAERFILQMTANFGALKSLLMTRVRLVAVLGVFAGTLISQGGCQLSFTGIEFRRAEKALEAKKYDKAVKYFENVIKRQPDSAVALEAARQAARVSLFQTEEFAKSINFFKHLVIYSKKSEERKEAQRNIASIYFEKLADYRNAIIEYNKLISLPHSPEDEIDIKFSIAKSYFYLNKFFQARVEVDQILKKSIPERKKFQLLFFKGNILLTNKDVEKAISVFEEIKKTFPKLALREKVDMNIAVCYEELHEYEKAIKVLQAFKQDYPNPDFIDLKIKRLRQRQANLPGAKGYFK